MSVIPNTGQWGAYFAQLKRDRVDLEFRIQNAIGPLMGIEKMSDTELRKLAKMSGVGSLETTENTR
jgi:hypothetical protein